MAFSIPPQRVDPQHHLDIPFVVPLFSLRTLNQQKVVWDGLKI